MGRKFPIQPLEGRRFCPEKFLTYVASGSELFFPRALDHHSKMGARAKKNGNALAPVFARKCSLGPRMTLKLLAQWKAPPEVSNHLDQSKSTTTARAIYRHVAAWISLTWALVSQTRKTSKKSSKGEGRAMMPFIVTN